MKNYNYTGMQLAILAMQKDIISNTRNGMFEPLDKEQDDDFDYRNTDEYMRIKDDMITKHCILYYKDEKYREEFERYLEEIKKY